MEVCKRNMSMTDKNLSWRGSYTVEAAIYIPIIIVMLFYSLDLAIDFWQESAHREVCEELQNLNIVDEFYGYQILDETGKEIKDD